LNQKICAVTVKKSADLFAVPFKLRGYDFRAFGWLESR
jgi:hypothetical protein